jgi:hypothetical protein
VIAVTAVISASIYDYGSSFWDTVVVPHQEEVTAVAAATL